MPRCPKSVRAALASRCARPSGRRARNRARCGGAGPGRDYGRSAPRLPRCAVPPLRPAPARPPHSCCLIAAGTGASLQDPPSPAAASPRVARTCS
ncbi:hypothetical protein CapIbe_000674 [Capra ibex]